MAKPQSNPPTKKKPKHKRRPIHGPATAAMKSKAPAAKPNPFETLWSRRKFDVLGKRRKGEDRRLGLSRSIGVEKRKKTLMKEYEESVKSSVFVDRRIGEKDGSLEEFEKAVLRMQRERQSKLKRASKYNLSDGEEDEDLYQSNSLGRDDFDDEVPSDDFDDADINTKNSGRASRNLSLSSMPDSSVTTLSDGEENANKTKSQVMKEIILKSKFYKAEKAKAKEEDEHLMEKLDQDFTSLAQSKALVSLTRPSKINALKALLNKHNIKQPVPEGSSHPAADEDSSAKEQPDEYDKLVKELVLDRRAYASDRTKTPEEIAQEEKERLEELEKQRRERMLATDDSADEASEDGEEMEKPSSKKIRLVSGDDLGDSFSNGEDTSGKKGWVDQIYENDGESEGDEDNSEAEGDEDAGDSDESNDEDAESDDDNSSEGDGYSSKNEFKSVKEWEQSDDDLCINAEEAEHQDGKEINSSKAKLDIKQPASAGPKVKPAESIGSLKHENLPYVIEAPKSLAELRNLLDKCSNSEVLEAINRIRACNSVKLSAENRKKMQVFYGVLLQYFAVLANERPLKVNLVNSLVKPLIEISSETPYFAAICARQRLMHIRSLFVEDIKILGKSCWPSLKTLLLLRLWSLIFPCSDFRHVVMTPVILLMCEYLMRCPLTSGRDTAVGSFLCSLLLMIIRQSRKFCPEVVVFLQTLLLSSLEKVPGQKQHFELNYLMEIRTLKPWLHISDHVHDLKPADFITVMTLEESSSFFASSDFKASILASVAETLKEFVVLYEGLSSFSEIFSPISLVLCEVLKNPNLPSLLRNKMQSISDTIVKKSDELNLLRKPLQMRKQKPVPIKLLNPKFEEDFVKGRDYDPDRERAEMRKLKKRLKSEKKGAIRELRKDSQFISRVKEKNRLMEEQERAEKYGKDLAFLQEQEHAFKSGQLGKGRKRRK